VRRPDGTIFAENTDVLGFSLMLQRFCERRLKTTAAGASRRQARPRAGKRRCQRGRPGGSRGRGRRRSPSSRAPARTRTRR
jgi:hypothetical protein